MSVPFYMLCLGNREHPTHLMVAEMATMFGFRCAEAAHDLPLENTNCSANDTATKYSWPICTLRHQPTNATLKCPPVPPSASGLGTRSAFVTGTDEELVLRVLAFVLLDREGVEPICSFASRMANFRDVVNVCVVRKMSSVHYWGKLKLLRKPYAAHAMPKDRFVSEGHWEWHDYTSKNT